MHTTRASKQPKTGPEMWDLDGDGKRFAVSVNGVIRFTGTREACEKRLGILTQPTTREQQDKRLGRIFGAFVLMMAALTFVPRGTALADSSITTTQPVQGVPYNAAPIRQNFQAAAADIGALQSMNAGASAPSNPTLGTLWLDTPTGETMYILKVWDNRTNQWVVISYFDSLNSLWVAPVGGGLSQTILTDDTTDLGAYPNTVLTVTGAGPVYSFGTSSPAGTIKILTFSGVSTIVYNATSLITPGAADITTAANDMIIAVALGSGDWQVMFFQSAAASVAQGGTGRTSLTQYAVLLGAGTSPVNFAAPGTAGYPLRSTGASSNPAFGQLDLTVGVTGILPVANGGTGLAAITAHDLLVGNGTSAATLLAPGTTGLPLVSLGASLDPHWAILGVPGGGTGLATLTAHAVMVGASASNVAMVGPGTANYPLIAQGGSLDPTFAPLNLATVGITGVLPATNGGTGIPSPNAHTLLAGNVGSAMNYVGPGTSGYPLIAAGAAADPAFAPLSLAGAAVTGVLPQANFTMTPTFTTLTTTGDAAVGGSLGITTDLSVTGVSAFTGDASFSGSIARDSNFYLTMIASNPVINLGVNSYITLDRGSSVYTLFIGGVSVLAITSAGNVTIPGCLNYNGGTLGVCL